MQLRELQGQTVGSTCVFEGLLSVLEKFAARSEVLPEEMCSSCLRAGIAV